MKSYFNHLALGAALISAPLYLGSCSSGSESEEVVASEGGITAKEFSTGAAAFHVFTINTIVLRPQEPSAGEVADDADVAAGISGSLEIGEESIPVLFTYSTLGTTASGVLTATIEISLNGVENVSNSALMTALGAPTNGRFLSATIHVNYLTQTLTIESRVIQPISIDPDVLGSGDLITGVNQPQSSFLNNIKFFYSDINN